MNENLIMSINESWGKCYSDLLKIRIGLSYTFEEKSNYLEKGFMKVFLKKLSDEDLNKVNEKLIKIRQCYASNQFWQNSESFSLDDEKIQEISKILLEIDGIFNKYNFQQYIKYAEELDSVFNELKNNYYKKYTELMDDIKNRDVENELHKVFKEERESICYGKRFNIFMFYIVIAIMIYIGYNFIDIKNLTIEENIHIYWFLIVSKVILFFPLSWLVLFLSRRISEQNKIEQTYLHKELVSKAYVNHLAFLRTQFTEDTEEIRKSLTKVAIGALGLNPALLLEKSTTEKIPMEDLILKIVGTNLKDSNIK